MPHALLLRTIEEAFADAVLGNGIGLHEANAIDSRESPDACRLEREKDEEHDWRKIPIGDLNRCFSAYNWLDEDGLRFYLPAMMIAELSGMYGHNVGTRLSCRRFTKRYDLFTRAQRDAVITFLNWCLSDGDYNDSEREDIVEALLNGYWKDA
jgi:hypothetical protein